LGSSWGKPLRKGKRLGLILQGREKGGGSSSGKGEVRVKSFTDGEASVGGKKKPWRWESGEAALGAVL